MKKIFLSISFLVLSYSTILACPFCGCGNSNFQIGILPNYTHAFVGLRYTYAEFHSQSHDGSQFSHDYFHSAEMWGGYQLGKVQLMAFVPYITTHKVSDDGVADTKGIGDIILMGNYKVFSATHTNSETHKTYSNTLLLGGGIKFHTGQSNTNVTDPTFTVGDFSSMPGTGSTDFLINATHNFLSGDNGIITDFTYRMNTTNAQQFRYGNRIYLNTAFFHSWALGLNVIRPSVGLNLVTNNANHYQGQELAGSSGYVLSGLAGVNFQRGKVGVAANGYLPIVQNLYDGQTRFQSRGSLTLMFLF